MAERSKRAEQWVEGATRALARLDFDAMLAGLTIKEIEKATPADGSHLNRVFKKSELVRRMLALAGDTMADIRTHEQVLRLIPDLTDGRAHAVDAVRDASRENVAAFMPVRAPRKDSPEELRRGQEVIAWLAMIAVDGTDRPVRFVTEQYERLTDQYVGMYNGLLGALDRVPVRGVGTTERLAWVMTAVVDGLTMRAQAQPGISPPDVFADVVVELFAGLTRRSSEPEPDWAARLARTPQAGSRVLRDGRATAAALTAALDTLDGSEDERWLSLAGFPGELFGRAARASAAAVQLDARVRAALANGWYVRHLVAVESPAHARHLRAGLESLAVEQPDCALQVRVGPRTVLAPVVVGDDFALLGLENRDHRGFVDAHVLDGREQSGFAITAFKRLWDAPGTRELWTEDGPDGEAIAALTATR